jgi:hypothetical protein
MMEAVCSSERSVFFNETTWQYIPEGCHLHTCCENLKYRIKSVISVRYPGWFRLCEISVFHGNGYEDGWLSSGMLHCVVWKILTDVSKEFTIPIIGVIITLMMEALSSSECQSVSTKLHNTTCQKTAVLIIISLYLKKEIYVFADTDH